MKCDKIKTIMEHFRELHSIMMKVLPKEHINQHPFDYFKDEMDTITTMIDTCKQKFQKRLDKTKDCSHILIKEYKNLVSNLKIEETVIPKFSNVHMEVEFVLNELDRIVSKRRQLENNIIKKSEDIYELLGELGFLEKKPHDVVFNLIDEDRLSIDRISISNKMIIYKEKFEKYEETFTSAGLHRLYLNAKELFVEKHFKPECNLRFDNKQLIFGLSLKEQNEEMQKLYASLKLDKDVSLYRYVYSQIESQEISFDKLKNLEIVSKILYIEKMEKEKTRRTIFRNISNLLKRLGIIDRELFIDQKLFILEELERKYSKMVEDREKEVIELLNSIRNKEEILNLNIKDFKEGYRRVGKDANTSTLSVSVPNDSFLTMDNDVILSRIEDSFQETLIKSEKNHLKDVNGSITNSNLEYLKKYLQQLSEECEDRINEIYTNTMKYLKELCKLFTLKIGNYEVSTEGINEMRKTIEDLEPKKDLYLEIAALITKREELLMSMNEFEKIASDPRRLFKSSFQLLREEKFRKSAFPSLLKIEDELLKLLEEYKQKFGEFKKDDKLFELTLKEEIDGRIINKTVFINKFDSPRRKKN